MSAKLRKRKREHGKIYIYLDVYSHGSRKTELLAILTGDRFHDKETMKICEEVRAKRDYDLKAEKLGVIGTYNKKRNFIQYCRDVGEQHQAKNTRLSWQTAVFHLREFAGDGLEFKDLNNLFFERFRDYLLKQAKLAPSSGQSYLGRIKTALHKAVREGIMAADPSANITIKKKHKLPVHLSLEEIRNLSNTLCSNEQVKSAFLFSCFTGLRYSDVDALTWDNIRDGFLEFSQRKTGDAERLPLSDEAKRILKRQEGAQPSPNLHRAFPESAVFFMPKQSVVDKQLKKWAKDAGITKTISFHKSRHTFATLALSSGVDLYTTSKLLGHRNIQTTQIYAKVVDEKKKQAVAMLPTL